MEPPHKILGSLSGNYLGHKILLFIFINIFSHKILQQTLTPLLPYIIQPKVSHTVDINFTYNDKPIT